VAGGGSSPKNGNYGNGGGGAGGFLTGFGDTMTSPLVPGQTYPVTVGAGGAITDACFRFPGGNLGIGNGENSHFNGITAIGGGGGGTQGCGRGAQGDFSSYPTTYDNLLVGQAGGSGGGGGNCAFVGSQPTCCIQYHCDPTQVLKTIGRGTAGQGFDGGQGGGGISERVGGAGGGNGGGGGGAGGPGIGAFTMDRNNNPVNQGSGGPGKMSDITGVPLYYAGGGGGGGGELELGAFASQSNLGNGGIGGGGGSSTLNRGGSFCGGLGGGSALNAGSDGSCDAYNGPTRVPGNGGANTGGGAGGCSSGVACSVTNCCQGAMGGSGVVIISYPVSFQRATTTGNCVRTEVNGMQIYKFLSSGSFSL